MNRLPEIVAQWRRASQRMRELGTSDPYTASAMMDIPAEHRALIDTIEADALCRASFSSVPSSCHLVDIDSLVAPQRDVN